jgi:hypothetical protein
MNHKFVVRGSMGIFYFPHGATGNNQTGFNQTTPFNPTLDSYLTPAATLSNPFPTGLLQPAGAANGLSTYLGQGVSFYNPNPLAPYSIRFGFDIQRELAKSLVLQVGYIGNHAVHQALNRSLDYTPAQYLSTSPFRDQTTINLLTSNVPSPFANLIPGTNLNGSTVALSQLLMAYPQFTGVTAQAMNDGSTYFNSLNVRLQKRYSHGLTLVANYAYSKLFDKTSRLNASDLSPSKTLDSDDRPHRLVISSSYELPLGKKKLIGSNVPAVVNHIIGGWVFNAILTKQSGQVLSWGSVIYLGGDLQLDPRNIYHAFNTTLFNTNSSQQLANNIRTFPPTFGNLRSNGVYNYDMSFIKDFGIWERVRLQYRAEFFNALNHPQFSAPNLSPTSSTFGTITGQANNPRQIQMALRLTW